MNRKGVLEAASKAVHAEDMEHDYGKPEDNFATIAELWNTYLDAVFDKDFDGYLSSRDVAVMMILLKVARAATSIKADHWIDIAGYAACGGEIDGTPGEETVTTYADNKEAETIVFKSLGKEGGRMNELLDIYEHDGDKDTLLGLAEECSELSAAALKLVRAIEGKTPKSKGICAAAFLEEFADVECMMMTIMNAEWFDVDVVNDTYDAKIKRWRKRLEQFDKTGSMAEEAE